MSCLNFDWKAYALDELAAAERPLYQQHLAACAACRAEAEGLGVTLAALARLPQVEPPRRIGFISDPVFAPSWWQRFWNSAPRLGFAAAALLAAAIVVHGFASRPAPQPALAQQAIDDAVHQKVAAAVASVDARHNQRILELAAQLEQRFESQRAEDGRMIKAAFELQQRQFNTLYMTAARRGDD